MAQIVGRLRLPRLAEPPLTPETGEMYFDTVLDATRFKGATGWKTSGGIEGGVEPEPDPGGGGIVVGEWQMLVLEPGWMGDAFWRTEGDVIRLLGNVTFGGSGAEGYMAMESNNPGLASGREGRFTLYSDNGTRGALYLNMEGLYFIPEPDDPSTVWLDGATYYVEAVVPAGIYWEPYANFKWSAQTVIHDSGPPVHTNDMPSGSICKNNADPVAADMLYISDKGGSFDTGPLEAIGIDTLIRIGFPAGEDPPSGFECVFRVIGDPAAHSGFEQVTYWAMPVFVATEVIPGGYTGDPTHFGVNHMVWLSYPPSAS